MDNPARKVYNRRMHAELGIRASTLLLYGMIFGEAVVFAWLLTPLTLWLAPRLGYLDHPGHRKVHAAPKPVLGGLAIFGAFQLMILGNLWLGNSIGPLLPDHLPGVFGRVLVEARLYHNGINLVRTPLIGFLLGGWLVFVVGLVDDRVGMHPFVKLFGQCCAGAILYFSGTRIDFLHEVSPAISFLATILWVAMVANAFNWIDNMDGLCAGIAAVNCFFFAMVSHQIEAQVFLVLFSLSLCGACIGFLHWNRYPSKLFMGDSGSMFIGYTIAAL